MNAQFNPVTTTEAIDQLLEQSQSEPVVLFNHDPYCPISAAAYQEMRGVAYPVAMIDVARLTNVSKHVAQRTQVKHESPQVIVLANGAPIWSASHFGITQEKVESALEQAGAAKA